MQADTAALQGEILERKGQAESAIQAYERNLDTDAPPGRRQQALQAGATALAQARARAQEQVSQARNAIEQDKAAAQTVLQAKAGELAAEIVRTVLQPVATVVSGPAGGIL